MFQLLNLIFDYLFKYVCVVEFYFLTFYYFIKCITQVKELKFDSKFWSFVAKDQYFTIQFQRDIFPQK